MRIFILPDVVDVCPLIIIEHRFAEIFGGDAAVIPALAVEVFGDLGRLEHPAVAGEDLVSRQAALLPAQILQIRLGDIAAVAARDQVFADFGGGRRGLRRGNGRGRFGRNRRSP